MDEVKLINAEELKSDLKQYFSDGTLESVSAKLAFNMILRKIDDAPTVKPTFKPIAEVKFDKEQLQEIVDKAKAEVLESVERSQGEWKTTKAYPHKVYCGKCFKTYAQGNWEVWKDGSLPRNFCPNCGADMQIKKKIQTPSCLTNPERQAELLERYKEE